MRKYTILAVLIFFSMNLFSQVRTEKNINYLYQENENYIRTYSIMPTIHWGYLIKLNTCTGQIWQIKLNHKNTDQFEIPLTNFPLVEKQNEVDNRFKLFRADNQNFLLLDQINGKIWQVTWHVNIEKNEISVINDTSLIEKENISETRFTLNPTIDSRYFLILDKINGNLWQLNWSARPEKSKLLPIR